MIELTTSFATIVGLLADFAAHRADQKFSSMEEFAQWLREHGHAEIQSAIEANHATSLSIKATLAQGNRQILALVESIDQKLTALCEPEGALGQLAKSINPENILSEQAKSILLQFEEAGAGLAMTADTFDGRDIMFLDVSGGVTIVEPRFLEDDINRMAEFGLLRLSIDDSGDTLLHFTRLASSYAKALRATRDSSSN